MNSCEFAYFGRDLHAFQTAIASWCSGHDCLLELSALLDGARLRISGSEDTIPDAIRMVREWTRHTS
jgi:hypothetical protein